MFRTAVDVSILSLRDGLLENLWGGGGEVEKKYSRKGKLNEKKNSSMPINPKKIFMLWPKKDSYKEFYDEKNSCGS